MPHNKGLPMNYLVKCRSMTKKGVDRTINSTSIIFDTKLALRKGCIYHVFQRHWNYK